MRVTEQGDGCFRAVVGAQLRFVCASGRAGCRSGRAAHDRLLQNAGVDAEPIPELEFDQTFEW